MPESIAFDRLKLNEYFEIEGSLGSENENAFACAFSSAGYSNISVINEKSFLLQDTLTNCDNTIQLDGFTIKSPYWDLIDSEKTSIAVEELSFNDSKLGNYVREQKTAKESASTDTSSNTEDSNLNCYGYPGMNDKCPKF